MQDATRCLDRGLSPGRDNDRIAGVRRQIPVVALAMALLLTGPGPAQDRPAEPATAVLRQIAALSDDSGTAPVWRAVGAFVAAKDQLHGVEEQELLDATQRLRELAKGTHPRQQLYYEYYVAWVWTERGRLDRARQVLVGASERFPDETWGRNERDELLCDIYREQGRTAAALELLVSLQERCENDSETPAPQRDATLASVHGLRGELHVMNGLLEAARMELGEEQRLAEQSGDTQAIRNSLRRRIDFYLGGGDLPRTRRAIDELARSAPELVGHDALCRGTLLFLQARRERSRDEGLYASLLEDAADTLVEAVAASGLDRGAAATAMLKLLEIELLRGQLEQATGWARRYREAAAVPRSDRPGRFSTRRSLFHCLNGLLDVATAASTAQLELDLHNVEHGYRQLLADWRALAVRPGGVGALHDEQRRLVLGALITLTIELAERQRRSDGPARALDRLLEVQALNSLARMRGAPACLVEDVRDLLLQPGCGILVFLPTRHGTHLFSIDDDAIGYTVLAARADLVRDTERLSELLSTHARDAMQDPRMFERLHYWSRAVRDRLLTKPVADRVASWRGLTVVGAEMLDHVPFEALLAPDDERLLGEVMAVDNLSSLPLGVHLARHRPQRRGELRLLLLACTDIKSKLARQKQLSAIPFPIERADQAFLRRFGENANRRIDSQLTRASYLAEDLTASDIVHVIAHLVRRSDVELQTGLALSDAPVWHEDLLDKPTAGIAIIGACASGRSAPRTGDSPLLTNLGGTFLASGSHSVILSQTEISLRDHLQLSAAFYEALRAGHSPAESLRRARQALARPDDVGRFYRATMQLFGLGQLRLR